MSSLFSCFSRRKKVSPAPAVAPRPTITPRYCSSLSPVKYNAHMPRSLNGIGKVLNGGLIRQVTITIPGQLLPLVIQCVKGAETLVYATSDVKIIEGFVVENGQTNQNKKIILKYLKRCHFDESEAIIASRYTNMLPPIVLNDQHVLLVQEYIQGGNLVGSGGKLNSKIAKQSVAKRLYYVVQLIEQCHLMQQTTPATGPGIIHGDLKGGNVLLSEDGSTVNPIDFGFSRPVEQQRKVIGNRTVRGNSYYFPPEGYRGNFYPQTDVFMLVDMLLSLLGAKEIFKKRDAFYDKNKFHMEGQSDYFLLRRDELRLTQIEKPIEEITLEPIFDIDLKQYVCQFLHRMANLDYRCRPDMAQVLQFFTSLWQLYVMAENKDWENEQFDRHLFVVIHLAKPKALNIELPNNEDLFHEYINIVNLNICVLEKFRALVPLDEEQHIKQQINTLQKVLRDTVSPANLVPTAAPKNFMYRHYVQKMQYLNNTCRHLFIEKQQRRVSEWSLYRVYGMLAMFNDGLMKLLNRVPYMEAFKTFYMLLSEIPKEQYGWDFYDRLQLLGRIFLHVTWRIEDEKEDLTLVFKLQRALLQAENNHDLRKAWFEYNSAVMRAGKYACWSRCVQEQYNNLSYEIKSVDLF